MQRLVRYYVCDEFWRHSISSQRPIFFYTGNEGNVEIYIKFTGFMWEQAEYFGALLVFAEHRYYGKSQPIGNDSLRVDPSFLSVEQALADYVALLAALKQTLPGAADSPAIAFGGSYGGMLSAWLRMKYPWTVIGALAASAPIGAYVSALNKPAFEPERFWEVVTRDAELASASCPENVREAFSVLFRLGEQEAGREELRKHLHLCAVPKDSADVTDVAYWIQGAFDAFAMGNYPYESSYIGGSAENPLPAWPMRAACGYLSKRGLANDALLQATHKAVSVLYNASRDAACYNASQLEGPAGPGATWLFQWCTQRSAQELPYFPANGRTDMFWDQGPYNDTEHDEQCLQLFNVTARRDWAVKEYGGFAGADFATNIIFSNGRLDPWIVGGIVHNISDSVVATVIDEGAHHLDLMDRNPDDPPSVVAARRSHVQHMQRWLDEYYARSPSTAGTGA
ncbi:hypothetical protein WJX81_000409 [Elliptochloris bilobata]|uniref:Lysosomal Pro-X carboxypeptidase n=1 Tax=Elliptochloris bilobata TaxID=381761 RepID=A0AAW1S4D7_9CHLO